MPTILIIGRLRFVIYPKDHKPAHVHVLAPEAEAKFDLRTFECLSNYGFSKKALRRIVELVEENKTLLEEAWYEYQE